MYLTFTFKFYVAISRTVEEDVVGMDPFKGMK